MQDNKLLLKMIDNLISYLIDLSLAIEGKKSFDESRLSEDDLARIMSTVEARKKYPCKDCVNGMTYSPDGSRITCPTCKGTGISTNDSKGEIE